MNNIQNESSQAFGAVGARVRDDARQLASSMNELSTQARETLDDMIEKRPYVTLGVAFVAGYVLAGGLSSRLTRIGALLAGRYLMNTLGSEMMENVQRTQYTVPGGPK